LVVQPSLGELVFDIDCHPYKSLMVSGMASDVDLEALTHLAAEFFHPQSCRYLEFPLPCPHK